jgi:hypothetical protein
MQAVKNGPLGTPSGPSLGRNATKRLLSARFKKRAAERKGNRSTRAATRHHATAEPRIFSCAGLATRADAGNCSTVARWPSHRRVTSAICPSGNSRAS